MSEKITSTFTFHGNSKALEVEKEIIRRFKKDYDKGNDNYSVVTRILYDLDEETKYDSYELLGAYQCMYFGSTHKLQIQTATCPPTKLHDYLIKQLAKIDPMIVIQNDYVGNTPEIVGCRFACLNEDGEINSGEAYEELSFSWCGKDEVDEFIEDGVDPNKIMTYEALDELAIKMRQDAYNEFNENTYFEYDLEFEGKPFLGGF